MSVFGVPITDETLKRMSKYRGKIIRQEDRAREAKKMIQADNKNWNALNHAAKLKSDYGTGLSTLCLIYNATGSRLEQVQELRKDWNGSVYKEEPAQTFENGQWIAFLHVSGFLHSKAARVYRGTNSIGQVCDYLVSWSTTNEFNRNSAFTKAGQKDTVKPDFRDLEKIKKVVVYDAYGLKTTVSIGGATTAEFIGIIEHKFDS